MNKGINQEYFINMAKEAKGKKQTVAVAAPHDIGTLSALKKAQDLGFVDVILVGNEETMKKEAANNDLDISKMEMVHAEDLVECAQKTIDQLKLGKASLIMKGLIDTSILLKAVLKKENDLRTGKTLSHCGILFHEEKEKYYLVSDAAMLIAPTLEQKAQVIENSVELAHSLGMEKPNVAMLCAKEKPYDKMPATLDAAELQKMNQEGKITGCTVSGPLQIDNAISAASAKVKGVKDPVAGHADIFVVPYIEVGNVFLKALHYLAGYTFGGVVLGAKVPIVLCSRADGEKEKLVSIAVACMLAAQKAGK